MGSAIYFAFCPLTIYCTYSEVRVEGLEVLDYLDNLHDKQRFTEQGDALTFESEVKANYRNFAEVPFI